MAKLYCILARSADTAVIFRRGPSKQVRLIKWDLKAHTFELGQWFKGRIYERKSDLSPDGRKLVYFAAKHKGALPTWIAVSTPPFLTAHVLWRTLGTYNDLSMFGTDRDLALATYRGDSSIEPDIGFQVPSQLQVRHKPWPGYFHKLADHDRLVRDGWSVTSGDPLYRGEWTEVITYNKAITDGTRSVRLQMVANAYQNVTYALHQQDGSLVDLSADWADVRGKTVFLSRGGKLLSIRVMDNGQHGPDIVLADFTKMTFEGIEAPPSAKQW
jgi:hypothetical protein